MTAKKSAKRSPRKPRSTSSKKRTRASATVLIVEDDVNFARGLTTAFEQAGFDVSCANSIGTTVELLQKSRFDVIIVDMRMPQKQSEPVEFDAGLGLVGLLQRFGLKQEDSILVVLTAYPSVRDCFASVDAGAYYLPKAVTGINVSKELVAECRRLVDERPARTRKPRQTWLGQHYDELVNRFGGKTVAIVDLETAKKNRLPGGTAIGGCIVFSAASPEKLQQKFLGDSRFRRVLPILVDVPKGGVKK